MPHLALPWRGAVPTHGDEKSPRFASGVWAQAQACIDRAVAAAKRDGAGGRPRRRSSRTPRSANA